ncbi:hypothetical protein SBA3_4920008 [Candidatus Sulfopaludibacter sp. SbA3]|nr:hypothetical protein SBA3_4920008 [Candidatus Sulfopaludibacter sp. SbA3]
MKFIRLTQGDEEIPAVEGVGDGAERGSVGRAAGGQPTQKRNAQLVAIRIGSNQLGMVRHRTGFGQELVAAGQYDRLATIRTHGKLLRLRLGCTRGREKDQEGERSQDSPQRAGEARVGKLRDK